MNYSWATTFRQLFERCADLYKNGQTDFETWFTDADKSFLASLGYKEREFFDFIDDHCDSGGVDPSLETALLIAAVRRDHHQVVQKGVPSSVVVTPDQLPAKTAEVDGIPWLPRLIAKAKAKLRGEMDPDTMYGCGGDRLFFSRHNLHPADFLRAVWAAEGNDQRIIDYVKSGVWHSTLA